MRGPRRTGTEGANWRHEGNWQREQSGALTGGKGKWGKIPKPLYCHVLPVYSVDSVKENRLAL